MPAHLMDGEVWSAWTRIFQIARRAGSSVPDAEDFAQTLFEHACRSSQDQQAPDLDVLTHRLKRALLKRNGTPRLRSLVHAATLPSPEPSPEDCACQREYAETIERALAQLPPDVASAFEQFLNGDTSYYALRASGARGAAAINYRIGRAQRQLRIALAPLAPDLKLPRRTLSHRTGGEYWPQSIAISNTTRRQQQPRDDDIRIPRPPAPRKDSPREPRVPTGEQVRRVPRWAMVAFAAHCARQAYKTIEVDLRAIEDLDDAPVRFVLEKAEGAATIGDDKGFGHDGSPYGARPQFHSQATNLRPIMSRLDKKQTRIINALEAAQHAAMAAETAGLAKAHDHWAGCVAYGHNAVMFATDCERKADDQTAFLGHRTARFAALAGVPDDTIATALDLLVVAATREGWTERDVISPSFFSLDADVERRVMLIVNELCVGLCELVAQHHDALRHIEWRQVEELVAVALKGIGFHVTLTPGAKDGGKDVIATCCIHGRVRTYYVEIKHWRSRKRVGANELEQFVEVNVRDRTDGGLFLSTSGYTDTVFSRRAEITRQRIKLGRDAKVASLCQHFVQRRKQAIWESVDVLPQILFEHTD